MAVKSNNKEVIFPCPCAKFFNGWYNIVDDEQNENKLETSGVNL